MRGQTHKDVVEASKATRQALYKALGSNGNMTLETLLNVLCAMGVRLSVSGRLVKIAVWNKKGTLVLHKS